MKYKILKINDIKTSVINEERYNEFYPYVEYSWMISYANSCDKDIIGTPTFSFLDKDKLILHEAMIYNPVLIPAKGSYNAKGTEMLTAKEKIDSCVKRKKIPIVLLIPGSGPTDRNSNNNMGITTNAFVYLAEALYKNGIASLRVDKRTSGKSINTFKSSILKITFNDFISDASLWIDTLKKDPRFSKLIVAGPVSYTHLTLPTNREV